MDSYSDTGAHATENVHELERVASVAGGAYLAWKGIGRDSMLGVALMALGGALLYRGLTGHCDVYGALGLSTAEPRPFGGPEPDLDRDEREYMELDDLVDEASEESFPASDPPSFTPGGPTEPDRL